MDATMFQLRSFVHHRMYAAAEEILGEVEKTITLAVCEVSRFKEEVESLRRQPDFLENESDSGLPLSTPALQEIQPPTTPEESSFSLSSSLPGPSKLSTDLDSNTWNYSSVETDFNMSKIKQEEMESGDESQTPNIAFLSTESVKTVQVQTQVSHEMQPVSTDDSSVHSEIREGDAELLNSKGEQLKTMKLNKLGQRGKYNKNGRAALPRENQKSQKARSFCHLCGKAFQYMASLMKHIKTHESQADCSICGKTHRSTKGLIKHLKRCHSKSWFCTECGKTFSTNRRLQLHSKTHSGITEFVCQECGKTFHKRAHLIVHVRTHSGEKPYRCEICGKAYSQSQNLTNHKRAHSGEKPFQCGLCGKLYSTSTDFKLHMRYHSGEKPYACDVCGKRFRQSGLVTRHKTTHTAERPFACNVCGVRYKFASTLKVHLRTHEEEMNEN